MALYATVPMTQAQTATATESVRQYDIPAGSLSSALGAWGAQSDRQVVYAPDLIADKQSRGVSGRYGIEQALAKLLVSTGLVGERVNDQTYAIKRKPQPPAGTGRKQSLKPKTPSSETDQKVATLDVVTVTASRIVRDGFIAPTPTITIGPQDLQNSAATDIAEVLNQLPMLRPSFNMASTTNNTQYSGGNYLDLRGIGFTRTLVLIDGMRTVPNQASGGVDINTLPQALINGIDVVTGGASAAWGSDAVAGVVNFHLNHHLEGFKGVVKGGMSDKNDRQNYMVSMAFGHGFNEGRGHFTLAAERAYNRGIPNLSDRDWGARQYAIISNPLYTPTNDEPQRILVAHALRSNESYGGVINSGPLKGIQFDKNGDPIPFQYGKLVTSSTMVGGDPNAGSSQDNSILEAPVNRHSFYSRMSYDITPNVTGAISASWSKASSSPQSGHALDSGMVIQRDNAFLPASIGAAMDTLGITSFKMGRYNRDYASDIYAKTIKTQRFSGSLNGYFGDTWSWNAYVNHGKSSQQLNYVNDRITGNFNLALDSIIDPLTGVAECRDPAARADGCIPINVFGEGAPSVAARAYVMGVSHRDTVMTQTSAAASISGEPFSMPAGPVSITAGVDYRRDKAKVTSDPLSIQGVFSEGNAIPWSGIEKVSEAFGEVLLPLATDQPWAQSLDLDIAGRYTHYATSGSVKTWKVGANWQVNEWFRLRGTQSRDIRAPSLFDLFQSGRTLNFTVLDPVLGESYSVPSVTHGNPNLKPEKADTTTVGFVLSPLEGLQMSLDYYRIDIGNAINTFSSKDIVNRCYSGQTQVCDAIVRGPDGRISVVNGGPQNLQQVRVKGYDFEAGYRTHLGSGSLVLHSIMSYVQSIVLDDGVDKAQLAGSTLQPSIGGIGGRPHWKGLLTAAYNIGPYGVNTAVRYIGGGNINNSYTPKDLNVLRTSGRIYYDVGASYDLMKSKDHVLTAFASVHNLFDKDPPITGAGGYVTTRSLYDYIGRAYTVGIRFDL